MKYSDLLKPIVFALLTVFTGQSLVAQNTAIWKRHAVDNTLMGADGVRFEDANGDGLADCAGLESHGFNPAFSCLVKKQFNH